MEDPNVADVTIINHVLEPKPLPEKKRLSKIRLPDRARAHITGLPKGILGLHELAEPEGSLRGRNDRSEIVYFGPKPPPVDPEHHYHFQVFALATQLDIKFGATRAELLAAMEGHVGLRRADRHVHSLA